MSSAVAPLMYAELLSHISRVSVIASFPTPTTAETRAQLSSIDRQQISLFHDGETTILTLPTRVAAVSQLQQPTVGSCEISWSLNLEDPAASNAAVDILDTVVAPWAASKLSPGTEIICRNCSSVLVPSGTVQSWRDLPNENWAEMMDFWHCHKPSEHNENGDHQAESHGHELKKGYGASNRFVAHSGVGFVSLTYFLLTENDCSGVEYKAPVDPEAKQSTSIPTQITCRSCHRPIGFLDPLASGLRLHKWSLTILPHSPSVSLFLIAHLLSLTSAQAIRKFILYSPSTDQSNPTTPQPPILHLWLFAPTLTVSFSCPETSIFAIPLSPSPILVTKLFYKTLTPSERDKLVTASEGNLNMSTTLSAAVEEVSMPAAAVREVYALLQRSTTRLPGKAGRFGEWEVGLLERFVDGR